jgi:hypothetical protein
VDILVEGHLPLELKAVEALHARDLAQTLSYLRMLNVQVGMLYNFNVLRFTEGGFRRVINPHFDPSKPPLFSVSSVYPSSGEQGSDDMRGDG